MMANRKMNRNSKYTTLIGLFVGTVLGFFVTARLRSSIMSGNLMTFTCGSESESFYSSADNEQIQGIQNDHDTNKGRGLVFVGVMTAEKFLSTRALAVYETWGKTLPGKIAFFTSSTSTTTANIPLIRLPGVDDSYPPQKKSFLMLKYMHDHFSDKFEWFMRADDDVYVRSDKLESFLRSVNSSHPHFIGQAGMGNKEEFGQLSLEDDENFCMGGPGMVLSRETLRRVVPHVKYCIKNLYSTHEDVEVGRCIRKFAGVSCTWAYEMQNIFYHNSSGNEAFTGNLRQKEIHRAITLHPIKNHQYQYRLHNYIQSLRIQELQQTILLLLRDIRDANRALNETSPKSLELDVETLGRKPSLSKFIASTVDDVIPWEFFSRVVFSDTNFNPKRRMEESLKVALDGIVTQVMESMNKYAVHRVIDFKEIYYGYKRVVPMHGVDYILDMLLNYKKYSGQRTTHRVRKHAYLQQAFTQPQIREIDISKIPDKTITFILPLSGRFSTFQRFMTNFENICLKKDEKVQIILVLYKTSDKDSANQYSQTRKYLEKIRHQYQNLNMKLIDGDGKFNRASALQLGASEATSDSLLFFVDVDMVFDQNCLERVRLNTIKGQQVYFPIVFSQYDPETVDTPHSDLFFINDDTGYWRQFGFGIGSIYKEDLTSVGGFDTSIHGWGREDVDLYDKIVRSNLTIFRAADPGLVHVYHAIECDKNLLPQQYAMCMGSQANSLGSVSKLADYIYKNLMNEQGTIISS